MGFDSDVFISYAHLDNQELMEGHKGWVANFHRALEIRVSQLLGAQPQIWRDPKLKGSDFFETTLLERLKRVAVLLSVISPRYLKSDWTRRELLEFWKNAEQSGGVLVDGKARVFKVLKTPVPLDAQPPELQKMLGYEFFRIDPETGRVRELDHVFGPDAQREFWMRVDDVAHDLSALLEALHRAERGSAVPTEPLATVYLAEVTSDLQAEHDAIRRDLQEQGCVVVPTRPLPLRGNELEGFLSEELGRCQMSIHLIGRSFGIVPEGGMSSIGELQNEFAIRRGQAGDFVRLLWMPDLLASDDPRQQVFIEHVRTDARVLDGADLLETPFEELRTVLRGRLEALRRPVPPVAATPAPAATAAPPAAEDGLARIYLVCDQRDLEAIGPWSDFLFDEGLEVVPSVFDGDESEVREYHEESLRECDGVLIHYGAGSEMWLRRKLREIQKIAGYGRTRPMRAVGICVAPPMSPAKAQFRTREAMTLPQPDGFSPDPLRPFIARLKDTGGGQQG